MIIELTREFTELATIPDNYKFKSDREIMDYLHAFDLWPKLKWKEEDVDIYKRPIPKRDDNDYQLYLDALTKWYFLAEYNYIEPKNHWESNDKLCREPIRDLMEKYPFMDKFSSECSFCDKYFKGLNIETCKGCPLYEAQEGCVEDYGADGENPPLYEMWDSSNSAKDSTIAAEMLRDFIEVLASRKGFRYLYKEIINNS